MEILVEEDFVYTFKSKLPEPLYNKIDRFDYEVKVKGSELIIHNSENLTGYEKKKWLDKESRLISKISTKERSWGGSNGVTYYNYKLKPNANQTKAYQYFMDKCAKYRLESIEDRYLSEERIAETEHSLSYVITYAITLTKPLTYDYAVELAQQVVRPECREG